MWNKQGKQVDKSSEIKKRSENEVYFEEKDRFMPSNSYLTNHCYCFDYWLIYIPFRCY
jgi:hypothetical protein